MTNLMQEASSNDLTSGTSAARVDMKFEIVVIPVSDVDRAKEFYTPRAKICSAVASR
jgi:hypothetical protein